MPPRSRRRAAQQQAQPPVDDDDVDFEAEVDGTVDLSEFDQQQEAADDVDFESMVADGDDVDFEAMGGDDAFDYADESEAAEEAGEDAYDDEDDVPAGGRAAGRSSRRGRGASSSASVRGRSARKERLAGASERKKAAKSARREAKKNLTPEQIAARRQAMKNGLLLTLLMVVLIGGAVGFYYGVMRVPPERIEANDNLREARSNYARLERLLRAQDHSAAEALIESTQDQYLALPMFAFANNPDPDPNDPNLVSVSLARQAYELNERFEARRADVQRVREDIRAKANFDRIMRRLSDLSPEAEPDLNALRADIDAFMDNPAYPDRGPDLNLRARYRNQFVLPVSNQLLEITRAIGQRIAAGTTSVKRAATEQAGIEMRQNRYGDALRLVDDLARQHPDADLAGLRRQILESARTSWESARNRARNEYAVAVGPGSADHTRQAAEERAKQILYQVVTRFGEGVQGVDQYVQEARQMQREFGFAQ